MMTNSGTECSGETEDTFIADLSVGLATVTTFKAITHYFMICLGMNPSTWCLLITEISIRAKLRQELHADQNDLLNTTRLLLSF